MTTAMHTWRRLVYGMAAIATLACAEGTGAPTEVERLTADVVAATTVTPDGEVQVATLPVTTTFSVNVNTGGDFKIADEHWIHFPRRAICDPASTYGPAQWDAPCAAATGKIEITAVSWRDATGRPRIDFTPALRFVPSGKENAWVTLTFADRTAAHDRDALILYCGDDDVCSDETLVDATLATNRSRKLGTLSRRIKHFSGYLVSAGRTGVYTY